MNVLQIYGDDIKENITSVLDENRHTPYIANGKAHDNKAFEDSTYKPDTRL